MKITRFNNTVIVEEDPDDVTLLHAADNVYHQSWKKSGVVRNSRKNHNGVRTVVYTFHQGRKHEEEPTLFTEAVQREFARLVNRATNKKSGK